MPEDPSHGRLGKGGGENRDLYEIAGEDLGVWGDPVRGARRPDKETRRDAEEGCMYVRDSTGVWGGERAGLFAWDVCMGRVRGCGRSEGASEFLGGPSAGAVLLLFTWTLGLSLLSPAVHTCFLASVELGLRVHA